MKYPDQTRNLNPHKEARMAMWLWSKEYSKFGGGSMDFWDYLSESRKKLCVDAVNEIEQCNWRYGEEANQ